MRVVLDTNIWLSAIFWEGEANRIIEESGKKFRLLISKEILLEIINVLNKDAKFQKFIENRKQNIEDLTRTILSLSELIEIQTKLNIISHKADNVVLETAVDGKAEYLVSYNKYVLDLVEFRKIRILSPTDFLKLIQQE